MLIRLTAGIALIASLLGALHAEAENIAFTKEDTVLRHFPDYASDEILKVPLGTRIEILKEAGAWCRVSIESAGGTKKGWLKRASLKFLE